MILETKIFKQEESVKTLEYGIRSVNWGKKRKSTGSVVE